MGKSKLILPIIVISQFFCTSLWFASNGVINDLVLNYNLNVSALGHLTSSVQLGFIIGTLVFAILTFADRFSPSKVFFISALLGAIFNLGLVWEANNLTSLLSFRFLTGFFLAGIYPVGMKIAADYYEKGLGKSLGFLVGALVIGTAFPHFLKDLTNAFPWKSVLILTSSLALFGGLLMFTLVPDGPFRKPSQRANVSAFFKVFRKREFRSIAFGYFGHMWELYAFWAFVPIILKSYSTEHPETVLNIPLLSFLVIGIGGVGCIVSGYLAQSFGTKRMAFVALLLSGVCCFISPFILASNFEYVFLGFLFFWGIVVISDSPLLSTLIVQNASTEIKGTALTIVSCVGFLITIISIQFITLLTESSDSKYIYTILGLGPIFGLIALRKRKK